MARIKLMTVILAMGWSLQASANTHIESVLSQPNVATEIKVSEALFTDHIVNASSFIQDFALDKLSGYSPSVETFAGPYRLFSTDSSTKLAETGSSGMRLACLGLMLLMARKRITL